MKRLLFFLGPLVLSAASYEAPWLGNAYEFEWQTTVTGAYYHSIARANDTPLTYRDNERLVSTTLACSLENWQCWLGVFAAKTAAESFNIANGSFAVRYKLLDDISGRSPVTMTIGVEGDFPTAMALRDPGLLYSSYIQGEGQISVGKEWAEGADWQWRLWLLGALGSGVQHSPWIRGKCGAERNFCDIHQIGLFLAGQMGFGQSPFTTVADFHSYGLMAYRFLDLSAQYTYTFYSLGSLGICYTTRLAATNFPAYVHAVALTVTIPFSI